MVYGWPIAGTFTVIVGLAMAEICSAYPTSGGLYFWSDVGAPSPPGSPAVIYRCTATLHSWLPLQRVEHRDLFTKVCTRLEDTARDIFSQHGWQRDARLGPLA
ncbi:hypothetical protein ACQ4PT_053384 [Festuca glaucescens]